LEYNLAVSIYTKKGDGGRTRTFYGEMSKGDELAEALGSIDEAISHVGVCRYELLNSKFEYLSSKQIRNSKFKNINIDIELHRIQNNLLTVGSSLAGSKKRLKTGETKHLEKLIDDLTRQLPKLTNFIYPMGELQVARAVCRRAERRVVGLINNTLSDPPLNLRGGRGSYILKYLNRLSDALFVIGRWVNIKAGVGEEIWA